MARALYKQSKIILADEPTSGLDVTNVKISGIGDLKHYIHRTCIFEDYAEILRARYRLKTIFKKTI